MAGPWEEYQRAAPAAEEDGPWVQYRTTPQRGNKKPAKEAAPDPTEGMGGFEKFAAGAGKAVADLGRSAGQGLRWASPALADAVGAPTQADIDEARLRDKALMDTGAGMAGNIGANIAMSLLPGTGQLGAADKINKLWAAGGAARAASLAGAAGMGAAQNAVFNPRGSDESLGGQLAGGAAMGAAGQTIGPMLAAGVQGARRIGAGSKGTVGQTLQNFSDLPPELLMQQINAGNRVLVPGSAPTTVQASQNAGLARLKSAVRGMYPNELGGAVDAQQNAARLAALNGISEVTGTAAEAANNAGNQIFREGSQSYGKAKQGTALAYGAIDPFNEARVGLPIQHVEAAAGKYFGSGSGGMPKELGTLVDDIKALGTVTEDPAIAANFKALVQGKASRPSAAKGVDIERDPLDVAIRKWGGVNIENGGGELKWLRQSDLGKASVVHGPLARRNGTGENWDMLAERAHEYGYINEPDPRLLIEQLGESARGTPVYSAHAGGENMAARAGAFDDMPDEFLEPLKTPGAVNLETLQNLRSRAGEMAYKAGLSGDQRLKAAAGQIKEHLDGALESAAGRSAIGDILQGGADVPQAMYRKGLGTIDFRAGQDGAWNPAKGRFDGGEGIQHVVSQRTVKDGQNGAAVAMSLPDILAHGKIGTPYGPEGAKRVNVSLGDDAQAVLSQSGNGKWLLTGWNDGIGAPGGRDVVHSPSAYTPNPSVIQDSAGADATRILGIPGEFFKPDMAQAQRAARHARIDQGNRFETGFAKRMWVDGADGMPKLTGGEIPRAAFNSGATQSEDIAQWALMGRPGEAALKNYAITNLLESAAPNGLLSSDKVGRWTRGRSEAIKGLLDDSERAALGSVRDDLQRAAAADALERVKGQSNTAEKLTALGLLDNTLIDRAVKGIASLPYAGSLLGAGMEKMGEAVKHWKYRGLPGALNDPAQAIDALNVQAGLLQPNRWQRGLLSPRLQQTFVPVVTSGD